MALSRRALLTAAPALIGCSRSRARTVRILAPRAPSPLQLPVVAAHELGYFREHDISTAVEDIGGGVRAIESALTGGTDVISMLFDPLISSTFSNYAA